MDKNEDVEIISKEFKKLMDKVRDAIRDLQDYHAYTEERLTQLSDFYNKLSVRYIKSTLNKTE